MSNEVQLHVDVSRDLWKAIKQVALDSGDTLKGVVGKSLEATFGDKVKPVNLKVGKVVLSAKPMEKVVIDEPAPMHVCERCRTKFPELLMTYHAKSMKWFCNDCVQDMKNGQA